MSQEIKTEDLLAVSVLADQILDDLKVSNHDQRANSTILIQALVRSLYEDAEGNLFTLAPKLVTYAKAIFALADIYTGYVTQGAKSWTMIDQMNLAERKKTNNA